MAIGFLLQAAHRRFREAIVAALEGSGLNPGQLAIAGALAERGAATQRELSDLTGIEKSSMVILLDGLEREGWVERRPHPEDRRAYAVRLTRAGRSRLAAVGPKLDAVEARLLAGFSAAERKALADALRRLSGLEA